MIDRECPHQVMVPPEELGGKKLNSVIAFHAQIGQPERIRSEFKDDRWCEIYCFREAKDASAFQALFGGEMKKAAN